MSVIIVSSGDTLTTGGATPFFSPNNIYEFINDHDLNEAVLEFPEGVVLRFSGGSLNNGTLVGNQTIIESPATVIFGKELLIDPAGTWKIDKAFSDWFDCYKNGYYIDPATFDYTAQTYDYGSTTGIPMGASSGASGDNDRHILQQLLNLSAQHTVITAGIYMVDSEGGTGEDLSHQLTWFGKKGLTLQIDGTLKMIPNSFSNSDVLLVSECEQVTLCGTGKLVGDLPEHFASGGGDPLGEGGMCLQVNSTNDLTVSGLTFEQGWGDGVYCSWRRYYSATDTSMQARHHWQNIRCSYNRRTGFVYEKGDDVVVTGSAFTFNGLLRRINILGTFSGVNIEPYGYADTSKRFCENMDFTDCIFENNYKGGLRLERVIGGVVDSNRFENNGEDIELLQCDYSSFDVVPGVDTLRKYKAGCINVINNQSRNSRRFIQCIDYPSRAIIENNYLQNTWYPFNGMWVDTVFRYNKVYNASNIMDTWNVLKNVSVTGNEFHHVTLQYVPDPNYQSAQMITLPVYGEGGVTAYGLYDNQVTDFVFQDNLIKDYSQQRLRGSGDDGTDGMGNPPMPYSKLKQYFIRLNTNMVTDKVVFKDNIIPRERFINVYFINDAGTYPEKIHFSNRVDANTEKLLLTGDTFYDEVYQQEAVVLSSGRTGPYDEWVTFVHVPPAAPYNVLEGQIIYDPATNLAKPVFWDAPATNDLDTYTYSGGWPWIYMPPPVIHWKNIGTCESGSRPSGATAFNTMGRTLIETDTGNMIKWNSLTSVWDVL